MVAHCPSGSSPANDATIRIQGPDSFSNNYTDITITAGGSVGVYGSSSNFIYLDSTQKNANTGTLNSNKVDVLIKAQDASYPVFGYGLFGWHVV